MSRRTAPENHVGPPVAGPYSPTCRVGGIIGVAGQAGIDPVSGVLVGDDVSSQTEQTFVNIAAVLSEAGASLDDVVSVQVYLSDLGDFDAMNDVYRRHFEQPYPARATVGVSLPPGMKVEIQVLAVAADGE